MAMKSFRVLSINLRGFVIFFPAVPRAQTQSDSSGSTLNLSSGSPSKVTEMINSDLGKFQLISPQLPDSRQSAP